MTADTRFERHAQELGHDFSGEIKIGGNYTPVMRDGHQFYVSGQIPRVGGDVLFVGAEGGGSNKITGEKMNSITIRQVVLADLDVVADLFDGYRQFYGQPSDLVAARTFLKARFEHGESTIFLAESQGQAVGFTQLYPSFSSVSMARVFVLNDLYVAPTTRRQGVGEALLKAASDHARQLGAVRLSLTTAVDNTSAQTLYESGGWLRDQKFYAYHLALK